MEKNPAAEDVIRFIVSSAPPDLELRTNPFRERNYPYNLVKPAVELLHDQGIFLDLEAFDLLGTKGMWNNADGTNYELARRATKRLLVEVMEEKKRVEAREVGWEEILPGVQQDTFRRPTGRYRTPLAGMFKRVYDSCPYDAVLDLTRHDEELREFSDIRPYDMKTVPRFTWLRDGKINRQMTCEATAKLVEAIQRLHPEKTLRDIVFGITAKDFDNVVINRYGTTLGGMLMMAYHHSGYQAIRNLVDNDPMYAEFKDVKKYDPGEAAHRRALEKRLRVA